jgi:endonuclease YncB( thermonuclease family)
MAHNRRVVGSCGTRPHADIVGVASVVDANTIEIRGKRIQLHGIDAPESSQTCLDDAGQKWRCGEQAALALQDLIGRRTVTCDERDVDRGRIIGRWPCRRPRHHEWLVAQGLALAYRRYSHDCIAAEDEARKRGDGCGPARSSRPESGGASAGGVVGATSR